jgi:16S rRNA (guanine1207-N2)-methyltransferase
VTAAVYGAPPRALTDIAPDAVQLSPLTPGAASIAMLDAASVQTLDMLAPPGALERRYALAQALRVLAPGGVLTALASKDRGGARLRRELEAFGCTITETAKAHHRICVCSRPASPVGIDVAIMEGGPQMIAPSGLWSQPGVFSWDRVDPGSALLAESPPLLSGKGADLGCGLGLLARAVLTSTAVTDITLIDIDRRAVEAARRNLDDPRATILWADAVGGELALSGLDFVVMNPPFHDAGREHRGLGQTFIRKAASALRKGGVLWMVANRHLPYEAVLGELFTAVAVKADRAGYKVFEAKK